MYWLEIGVTTDGEAAEAVSEMLRPFAYDQGVVFEQLGDALSPEPDALKSEITVKIYVPEEEDTPALRHHIQEAIYHMNRLYPIPAPVFHILKDEDWATAWRKNYVPFRIGQNLWIQPSWQKVVEADDEGIVITLDPGMAFGTGLHPTTQMCLLALEQYVQPDDIVMDVGTGSGILSIVAAKLGARRILAFDKDRQAVLASRENAIINRVIEKLELFQGTLWSIKPKPWDVILVNILAPVIIYLLDEGQLMANLAPRGKVILSGIIEDQANEVQQAVSRAGGKVLRQLSAGDWICLIVEHENTP